MIYLDGTVWLMSPSFPHERLRKARSFGHGSDRRDFDIPCIAAGSTTFRRRAKKGGVEGDQTYYLANEERSAARTSSISRPTHLPTWRSRPSTATTPTRRSRSIADSGCPRSGSATRPSWSSWSFSRTGGTPRRATSAAFPFLSAAEVYRLGASAPDGARDRVAQGAPPLGQADAQAARPPARPKCGLTTKPNKRGLEIVRSRETG